MSEIWDAYDKDRNLLLGKSIKRDTFSTDDDYHLVVEVLLLHEEDNSVLFMKRSPEKPSFPDYYEATAGGSALQGESSEQAVRRELLEETGLTVSRYSFSTRPPKTSTICTLTNISVGPRKARRLFLIRKERQLATSGSNPRI